MYYIDEFKNKANQAARTRAGRVVLSLEETTGLMCEIENLRIELETAQVVGEVIQESEETIYVDVGGGTFK